MKKINSNPLEIEEVFLDGFVKKKEGYLEVAERKIEAPLGKKKFFIFFIFGIFALVFILAITFNLQILNGSGYKNLALANKFLNLKIKAERGIIYDRNMKELVFNEARFDLYLEPSDLPSEEREEILKQVATIMNLSLEDIENKIERSLENKSILLFEDLSHQELVLFETKIEELPGIKINKAIKRNYLKEESLSHVLGYLGKISAAELKDFEESYEINDYVGKEGLEREYEKFLVEKKGVIKIERDVSGNEISRLVEENPSSGQSLVLSLDFSLQKKIADTLRETLARGDGQAAAALALNPQTGEILASVSLPSFDNNLFTKGISQTEFEQLNEDPGNPQLNRVLGGVYAVGSTIKPLISLAALEEGIVDEETTFFCPLELCLENKYSRELECYADWTFHGYTSIKRAIAESVNPFFYIIGGGYEKPVYSQVDSRLPESFEGLGSRKIAEWLGKFGWGEKTGIDLPGEVAGRVPTPEWKKEYFKDKSLEAQTWYLGDTYNYAIGQGYLLISPLQVATAFQAIANDKGTIFKPRIVKEILGEESKVFQPEILRQLQLSQENIEIVRQGMRQAVTSAGGSAVMMSSLPVSLAVKTGTAQTSRENTLHNWITLFAPYEDPEILMVMMIENVEGARIVAQTAAYEVLNWYFSR